MTLSTEALQELRAKAETATPGPWSNEPHMTLHGKEYGPRRIQVLDEDERWLRRSGSGGAHSITRDIVVVECNDNDAANAAFIAAANPQAIIALLDEIARLTAKAHENWRLAEEERHSANHWHARAEAAEAREAELRSALEPFAKAAGMLEMVGAGNDPSDEIELSGEALHAALRSAREAISQSPRTDEGRPT